MNTVGVYNMSVTHRGACLKNITFSVPDRVFFFVSCREKENRNLLTEVLCGLREPDSGTVLLLGRKPSGLRRDQKAVAVYRNAGCALFDTTLDGFLYHSCRLHGMSKAFARLYSQSILDEYGLRGYETLPYQSIPPLIRRTAAIAVSVCRNPAILIADDPADGLPAQEAEALYSLILAQSSMRSVVISGDSPETLLHSHRTLIIERGEAVCDQDVCDAAFRTETDQSYGAEMPVTGDCVR